MSQLQGHRLRVVLYEGPGTSPLCSESRFEVMASLLDRGFQLTRPAVGGAVAPTDDAAVLVLGQFDNQTAPADQSDNGRSMCFRDITGVDAAGVVTQAEQVAKDAGAAREREWKPWFPVIDYDRCTNCMQCLSFCLFDVYGVDSKDLIEVRNNDHCKTDCPACSRVCPEVAILFPKYGKGPINGDVVREQDIQRESMKVDISSLLGGDIYKSLRERQSSARKRFSSERDESRGLVERKKCLKKLQTALDIPDEVLMSLPSAGDIEERAERARAKTAKRLARSQTVKDQRPAPTEDDWGI